MEKNHDNNQSRGISLAAAEGKKTLIIDVDPRGKRHLGLRHRPKLNGLVDLRMLLKTISCGRFAGQHLLRGRLDLVGSRIDLAGAENRTHQQAFAWKSVLKRAVGDVAR